MKIQSHISTLLIAVFLSILPSAHAQIITTFAGGDSVGIGDGGQATACELYHPVGLVFDTAGNLYVAVRGEARIRKIAPDGIITTIAGSATPGFSGDNGPATAATLNEPYGIAADRSGNIFFVDYMNNRVRKINAAGIITTIAGTGGMGYNGDNIPATTAELNVPGGVAVDNAGNVYVTDDYNNRVRKINTSGIITTIAGTGTVGYNGDNIPATNAELNNPVFIAVDRIGNIYIADVDNARIRRIDTAGMISTFAGSGVPAGYAGDNGPATAAKIWGPTGMYPDNLGNVYFGDAYNNVVRKVNTAGTITTIAGNGTMGYSGDGGKAVLAELFWPAGLAMDAASNLYIADNGNNRIRRISSTAFVPPVSVGHELRIFPNPSKGDVMVNILAGTNEEVNIIIADITGHKVKEAQTITNVPLAMQIDGLEGVYMLRAVIGQRIMEGKIVKTK
jgi:sugar lactone lactonase YvrE